MAPCVGVHISTKGDDEGTYLRVARRWPKHMRTCTGLRIPRTGLQSVQNREQDNHQPPDFPLKPEQETHHSATMLGMHVAKGKIQTMLRTSRRRASACDLAAFSSINETGALLSSVFFAPLL